MTDRYCPLPWISAHSWCGDVTPCCLWEDKAVTATDASVALNSEFFEDIRNSMLDNKELKGCTQCYQQEAAGKTSRRMHAIKEYGRPTEVKLRSMDIGFDNVCNLKCRGCQSTASHLWHDDEIKLYGESLFPKKYWSYLASAEVDDLEHVHVSGGEPLLSKNFNNFASRLLKSKNLKMMKLSYDTNGSVLPKDNILELIDKVGKVRIGVSIDGLGKLQDYFRSGSKFDQVLKTLDFYKNLKNKRADKITDLTIQITVSVYNVNTIFEIYDYFKTNYPEYDINHRVLYWPEHLSIKNLPRDYKDALIPKFTNDNRFNDILIELQSDGKDLFNHFLNFHNRLDEIRNESLQDSNPMLSEYIKNYKTTETDSQTFFRQQLDYLREI